MEPVSKRTTSTDISLRYLEWEGDGSPVVLLHGLTVCAEYWSPTAQLLAQEGSAHLLGDLLLLANRLAYSVYLVVSRPLATEYPAITTTAWMFLFSTWTLPLLAWNADVAPAEATPEAPRGGARCRSDARAPSRVAPDGATRTSHGPAGGAPSHRGAGRSSRRVPLESVRLRERDALVDVALGAGPAHPVQGLVGVEARTLRGTSAQERERRE